MHTSLHTSSAFFTLCQGGGRGRRLTRDGKASFGDKTLSLSSRGMLIGRLYQLREYPGCSAFQSLPRENTARLHQAFLYILSRVAAGCYAKVSPASLVISSFRLTEVCNAVAQAVALSLLPHAVFNGFDLMGRFVLCVFCLRCDGCVSVESAGTRKL